MSNKKGPFIIACLSLLIGLVLYALFREQGVEVRRVIGLNELSINNQILRFFLGSLPSALWMFAISTLLLVVWNFEITIQSIIWLGIILFVGILIEFLQSTSTLPGSFDFVDILFMIIGMSISLFLFSRRQSL